MVNLLKLKDSKIKFASKPSATYHWRKHANKISISKAHNDWDSIIMYYQKINSTIKKENWKESCQEGFEYIKKIDNIYEDCQNV